MTDAPGTHDPGDPRDVPDPAPVIDTFDRLVREPPKDGDGDGDGGEDKRLQVRDGDLTAMMADLTSIAYDLSWGRWNVEGNLREEDWAALNVALRGYRQRITVELMNEMFGD
jgi:hypothetical protein